MRPVTLATEDPVSEATGERLVNEVRDRLIVVERLQRGGAGYLRSRIRSFCEIARRRPVLLITDLDRAECPPVLITEWLQRNERPEDLLLRVAVREVESWLLADAEALAGFLRIRRRDVPADPDTLADPKRELLRLGRKAPRALREELVAETGALANQGIGYNALLSEFVRRQWSPERAANRSPSLRRARERLRALAERQLWPR